MKPEILEKIASKWPHMRSMVKNYRATGDARIRNGIINAVLQADVAYLKPSEILYLSSLKAATARSARKARSSRDNGKLGGRPMRVTSENDKTVGYTYENTRHSD